MQLLSVNVGRERTIWDGETSGKTGIYKLPADGPVRVTSLGLEGDAVCDAKHHGGPDQAVYVYGAPDYAWWSEALGQELPPGTFGENLTISALESAGLRVGDRLQVGAVTLQVTAPRIPCRTLAARMEDPSFVKRFRQAERPGLYCRVLQEGLLQAGDPVSLEGYDGETLTILEMFRDYYEPRPGEAGLRRILAAPIAVRARRDTNEKLRKLLERSGADSPA